MGMKGSDVVSHHKKAVSACNNQLGWDKLSCIVDEMAKEYGKG